MLRKMNTGFISGFSLADGGFLGWLKSKAFYWLLDHQVTTGSIGGIALGMTVHFCVIEDPSHDISEVEQRILGYVAMGRDADDQGQEDAESHAELAWKRQQLLEGNDNLERVKTLLNHVYRTHPAHSILMEHIQATSRLPVLTWGTDGLPCLDNKQATNCTRDVLILSNHLDLNRKTALALKQYTGEEIISAIFCLISDEASDLENTLFLSSRYAHNAPVVPDEDLSICCHTVLVAADGFAPKRGS